MSAYNGWQNVTGSPWAYIRPQNVFRLKARISATSTHFAAVHGHVHSIVYFLDLAHYHDGNGFEDDGYTADIADSRLSHVLRGNCFSFVSFLFSNRQSFCKDQSMPFLVFVWTFIILTASLLALRTLRHISFGALFKVITVMFDHVKFMPIFFAKPTLTQRFLVLSCV